MADTLEVTVRYFAAARAAAGAEVEVLAVRSGATVADLVGHLTTRGGELSRVLARCSYLCDGIAVRDPSVMLSSGQTVDVLPPFAGG